MIPSTPLAPLPAFLAMMAIPLGITVLSGVLWPALRRTSLPAAGLVVRGGLVGVAITTAITVTAGFVLDRAVFAGFFFRPTTQDHGAAADLELAPEDLEIASSDQVRLHGWLLRADPGAGPPYGVVLHLHGSDANITRTAANVAWLAQRGWHVVVVDYRGYGRSTGTPSRRGVIDDANAALAAVVARTDLADLPVVLLGQSMGGQLAIHAAVEAPAYARERVAAVVADATYGSPRRHTAEKVARMGPAWLVHWVILLVASDAQAAEDVVAEVAPIPLLLLHGTGDTVVAQDQSDRLFDRAREPREYWSYEGAGHLRILRDEAARERLVAWLAETAATYRSNRP